MQSEPLHVDLKGPPHSSGIGVAFHLRGQTRVVCGTYDNTETLSLRSGGQEITLFVTPGQLRALSDAISRAVDCLDADAQEIADARANPPPTRAELARIANYPFDPALPF